MRVPAFWTAILAYVVIGHPPPAVALAASAGTRAGRRRDDLRRRVDVQGRGGMGHSRRSTAWRLRSGPEAAVRRVNS
jgi:hypothetical protein